MGRASYYPWTEQQVATLRASYPDARTTDLAASMGIPVDYIYRKAQGLGLRKSAVFMAKDAAGRAFRGGVLAQATQFKPGQKPWNAGKSYQAGGRSVQTQFKPGERCGAAAHNWVPVGSYRTAAKDNYLQRKTSDQHSGPRDWTSVLIDTARLENEFLTLSGFDAGNSFIHASAAPRLTAPDRQ